MSEYSQRLKKARHSRRRASTAHARAVLPTARDLDSSSAKRDDLSIRLDTAHRAQQQGRSSEARSHYEAILAEHPDDPNALHLLGLLHLNQHDPGQAVELIERAVGIAPRIAAFHLNLARASAELGDRDRACEASAQAAKLQPQDISTLLVAGLIHFENHHREAALDYFERVLTRQPDNVAALTGRATVCEQDSKLEEAQEIIDRLLPNEPGCLTLAVVAAKLQRRAGNHSEALAILDRARDVNPKAEISAAVQFELGQIHDAAGDYDNAFLASSTANNLLACPGVHIPNHSNAIPQELESLRKVFTKQFIESWTPARSTPAEHSPVFVFGFPRSGNTLLDQILKSHSQLRALMEKPMLRDVTRMISREIGEYPHSLATLSAEQVDRLRNEYFRVADSFSPCDPNRRIVDTHPMNTDRMGLMHRIFPDAKYVFVVRHPYDVCLSCFFQDFRNPLLRENSRSLEAVTQWYVRMMQLWHQYCGVLSVNYHIVRYENLVEQFDTEVQSLCDYLDIPWQEEMRDFNVHAQQRRGVTTASYHQVTKKLYRHARYRWKNYAEHLAPILSQLRPYAEDFDYPLD